MKESERPASSGISAPPAVWVVGVDGSEGSAQALRWAVARAHGAAQASAAVSLRVVAAWRTPVLAPIGIAGTAMLARSDDFERGAADRIDGLLEASDVDELPVTVEVIQGGAAHVLVDSASSAALLVVGSRGHSALRDLVVGSVSRQCCTHADVPVVVIPGSAPLDPPRRVVVGFDGSPPSTSAVRWATGAGRSVLGNARVTVVGAFDRSPFDDDDLTRSRFPDEVAEAEAEFHRALDQLDPERSLARRFVLDGARTALGDAVRDGPEAADLVVLGARGRGAIGAALLGSVSDWALHHLDVPLVIVPDR